MTDRHRTFLIALVVALSATGCELVDGSRPPGDAEPLTYIVAERHVGMPGEAPRLTLSLTSEREFPCMNYTFETRLAAGTSTVTLDVLGVEAPGGLCLTAIGPARATLPLDLAPGTYTLRIVNGGVVDTATLVLEDERVRIRDASQRASRPAVTDQWRYPERSFAFYCGTPADAADRCEAFDAALRAMPGVEPLVVPEEGTWPYTLTSYGHVCDAPARFYTYDDEATFAAAGALLAGFARDELAGRPGFGLYVLNWRNEGFYSWLVEDE